MHVQTWTAILGMAISVSAAFNPADYSYCLPDRGYVVADGDTAGAALYNELTPATGLLMTPGYCIYRHVNSTIVSLCNGSARNRTVTRGEVRRGVKQLQKDCGADGSYSGYHVVNNLTFANYGTSGFPTIIAPGNPPDTPGRRRTVDLLSAKFRRDGCPVLNPCKSVGITGTSYFCCQEPDGHNLLPDGSCPPGGPERNCQSYCEVKRTGILGMEQELDGIPYSQPTDWTKGVEVTVDTGFDIGISGVFEEVFEGSVGFTWSTSVTKTTAVTIKSSVTDLALGNRIKWVVFPNLIETCGSLTSNTYNPPQVNQGSSASIPAYCTGPLTTVGNICSISAALDGLGNPILSYAERIESPDGHVLKLADQSPSYRGICAIGVPDDPDGDGSLECTVPISK